VDLVSDWWISIEAPPGYANTQSTPWRQGHLRATSGPTSQPGATARCQMELHVYTAWMRKCMCTPLAGGGGGEGGGGGGGGEEEVAVEEENEEEYEEELKIQEYQ
jgi:hypothetical protein